MNSPEASSLAAPNKGWRYSTLRHLLLAAAFLLLLINPLLNYYWGIAFIQGWYQSLGIGELRLISPLEGLESLLISQQVYVPALIAMAIPLLIAVLLGRVFCSWVCPISFLAEMLAGIRAAHPEESHTPRPADIGQATALVCPDRRIASFPDPRCALVCLSLPTRSGGPGD